MGKVKSGSSSSTSGSSRVAKLEASLLAEQYNPNALLPLLQLARDPSPEVVHKAIWALHRVFIKYIPEGKVGGISSDSRTPVGSSRENDEEDGEGAGLPEGKAVKGWVRDRLLDYVEVLSGLIRDNEEGLRNSALPLLFSLLPPLSVTFSTDPTIHVPYFRMILQALLYPLPSLRGATSVEAAGACSSASPPTGSRWNIEEVNQVEDEEGVTPDDVLQLAQEEYWAKYDDLRWAFFRETARALKADPPTHSQNLLAQLLPLTNLPRVQVDLNTFFIPSLAEPPTGSDAAPKKKKKAKSKNGKKGKEAESLPDWMAAYESDPSSDSDAEGIQGSKKRQRTTQLSLHASVHSVPSHQLMYSTLWETVLATLTMDEMWIRRILVGLHGEKGILSHMKSERRVRVADWLGGLIDQGGPKAMLAMNGLYVLMTKFNLDYPNFYNRLYGLLDQNVLHVKYRARFFRLLDTFLASPMLPAAMVASFIKRLSRLALTAPPPGIIMVIPFIYNLFKRHPACMVMIQRPPGDSEDDEPYKDPYNPDEPSPFNSGAMASSCWELVALQTHYLASISTLAKVFNEVFTKPEYNMEDFLDHGYGTLFETEIKRHIKRPPALNDSLDAPQSGVVDAFPGAEASEEVRAGGDVVSQLWWF